MTYLSAHTYVKAPPAFAKDPWAWDYTRDRIEQNSGLTYDQWEGRHFAGASSMYKNVVKKYSNSIAAGDITPPRECIDCGANEKHYTDDYVCVNCRDAIENAGSYEAASQTITRPAAMEDIREQLMEKLGHKNKQKSAVPVDAMTTIMVEDTAPAAGGKVSRNYAAMNDGKLQKVIAELESNGDACNRATMKGESIEDHLESALRVAQERGI